MRKFVLQACKIRGSRFAPQKGVAPEEFDWPQLRARLLPPNLERVRFQQALANLRGMQINSFIGVVKSPRDGKPISFYFCNRDATNPDAEWVVSRDPTFPDRIVEVYRVLEADWGIEFQESETAVRGRPRPMHAQP
jgi:hypothetical protein